MDHIITNETNILHEKFSGQILLKRATFFSRFLNHCKWFIKATTWEGPKTWGNQTYRVVKILLSLEGKKTYAVNTSPFPPPYFLTRQHSVDTEHWKGSSLDTERFYSFITQYWRWHFLSCHRDVGSNWKQTGIFAWKHDSLQLWSNIM